MYLLNKAFWLDAGDRAVRTAAQVLIVSAALGDPGASLLHVGWSTALGTAGAAALASLLTSVAAYRAGTTGTIAYFPPYSQVQRETDLP